MKVVKEHEGHWNILSQEGKGIGSIQLSHSYVGRCSQKYLYVGEESIQKSIGIVKNQQDALDKLEGFFVFNKHEIRRVEKSIEELTIGISQVTHQVCIEALIKERDSLESYLEKLKIYDLI